MRNRYSLAAYRSWLYSARIVTEYAVAFGAALLASYVILQGRW